MSHYTVLVLSDEETTVEGLLSPFNENLEMEPYIKYTKAELIENQKKELEDYRDSTYAEFLNDTEGYKAKYADKPNHLDYITKEFPKLLKILDDNEKLYDYAIRYYEEEEITEDGSIISTYNPKSKWDWYVEGGRWEGLLRLKTGEKVNSAYAKEIDFLPDKEEIAIANRTWDIFVLGEEAKTEEEKKLIESYPNNWYKNYLLKRYKTKENYLKRTSEFNTYAVLTPDGIWYEPNQMGWFGISHANDKEEKDWYDSYNKFIKMAQENNWLMTIVDCHI